jgi:hypothetical protein
MAPPPPPAGFSIAIVSHGPAGRCRSTASVVVLSIVTLGIYGLVWQYRTFKEMKDYSGNGLGGGIALVLAVFFGIVNVFAMPAEVGNLYAMDGKAKPVSGATGLWVLLPVIGAVIWVAKVQGSLNRFWRSHGAA